MVPANSKILLSTFVLSNAPLAETVRRIRGMCLWSTDQSAANEGPVGALGVCLAEDTAIVAGIASLPDPITDVADDMWMLFQPMMTRIEVATAVGFQVPSGGVWEFDSKGMRKVRDGFSLAVIVANAHPTHGAIFSMVLRLYSTLSQT